jgi:hypothetical protein
MHDNRLADHVNGKLRANEPLLSARLRENQPRVAVACRELVRCIVTRGLKSGDVFPSHQELLALLSTSNNTLMSAMGLLRQAGVVSRQARFRTRVGDLAPLSRIGWSVAVAGLDVEGPGAKVFYADLLLRVMARLSRAHCTCRPYFRVPVDECHWPQHRLADYPQLAKDVREGRVDGILVLTNLDAGEQRNILRHGIPVCHVGIWPDMPSAVLEDGPQMIRDAYGLLGARGCRRVLLASTLTAVLEDVFRMNADGRAPGADGGPAVETINLEQASAGVGRGLAARLLQRPPSQRPDGLIVTDDYVTMGLTAALAEAGDYRPLLAARTNRSCPLDFTLPVFRYEVDSDELAAAACTMMLARLMNPGAPVEVRRFTAQPSFEASGAARRAVT